ncbi:hypothetical protein SDC9_197575 [bioreactor metagenome]|uniref:Uncharacterized protein n=1 Tax=bioreactor metagenome TaxID=1076179 RepID=A0A645IF56_9ZZZZ
MFEQGKDDQVAAQREEQAVGERGDRRPADVLPAGFQPAAGGAGIDAANRRQVVPETVEA